MEYIYMTYAQNAIDEFLDSKKKEERYAKEK